MLDFAIFAKGRADETDRITAVALNFEMKGKRFAFDGYQMSISTGKSNPKMQNVWLQMKCKMAADQVLKRFSRQIRKEDAYSYAPAVLVTQAIKGSSPAIAVVYALKVAVTCGRVKPDGVLRMNR